jgi:hypothetical protein
VTIRGNLINYKDVSGSIFKELFNPYLESTILTIMFNSSLASFLLLSSLIANLFQHFQFISGYVVAHGSRFLPSFQPESCMSTNLFIPSGAKTISKTISK